MQARSISPLSLSTNKCAYPASGQFCGKRKPLPGGYSWTFWGLFALLSAQPPRIGIQAFDTAGQSPAYQPAYLPWYDAPDTFSGLVVRPGLFKPYLRWHQGALHYEAPPFAFTPLSQEPYLLHSIPLAQSSRPYTRVRFDQSSRRTQLLSIYHAQYVHAEKRPVEGGWAGAYRRRTREGEYLSEAVDHYGAGISGFVRWKARIWLRIEAGWNQLQDQLHGGVLYDTSRSPWSAFEKQSQRVRITGLRWRRWHRYATTEAALRLAPTFWLQLGGRLTEDRLQSESPPPRETQSPFWGDSTALRWGVRQVAQTLSLSLYQGKNSYLRTEVERLRLRTDTLFLPWELTSASIEAKLSWGSLEALGRYQRWLQTAGPRERIEAAALWQQGPYTLGIGYRSRPLPWIAYQTQFWQATAPPNQTHTRFWASYRWESSDTTLPPLQITAWGSLWKSAWIWQAPPYAAQGFWGYGLTLEGGKQSRRLGLVSGLTLQTLTPQAPADRPWAQTLPLVSGWMQVFLRWQLPDKPPLYQIGARISGFSSFRLLSLDPHFGTPYEANFPYQPAYLWIDPYFVVHIRRVMVYLRVEHASVGLWAQGYYLFAWYPMPGRAFAFGVQWDIYN